MSSRFSSGLAGLCLALILSPGVAPAQGAAIAEARARLVCGSGTVVSATYIPGGLLQVTCRQNAPNATSSSNAGSGSSGTGLGTGGLAGGGVVVGVVAAAIALTIATTGSDTPDTDVSDEVPE